LTRLLVSPRSLTGATLLLLVASGLGWTFGPRSFSAAFLVAGFVVILVGGVVQVVIPRRRSATRLQADLRAPIRAGDRPGRFRRALWWTMSWTVRSPVAAAEAASRADEIVVRRKNAAKWPFGDTTTKLHSESNGFITTPGWFWNMPYKPVVSGSVREAPDGSVYVVKVSMAHDPPFEVMFMSVALLIGIVTLLGALLGLLGRAWVDWPFLPLMLLPLAVFTAMGQLGRWRLRHAGSRLTTEIAAALSSNAISVWPGWR